MTEHRPPACHYDRHLGERVTREHRDDCPNPGTHRGCAPCTAPHCVVCGREHASNEHPYTCPKCVGLIRTDLADLLTAYAALAVEALEGGTNGHLVAAAPIPGGTAAVLIGPTVRLDIMRVSRGHSIEEMAKTHRRTDPLPALAVLAQWEDMYRAWLGHQHPPTRATLTRAVAYLSDQVPYIANRLEGTEPDWLAFVHQVRRLRADAEQVLHDEREPEQGVECFECGDRLVRRFRVARRCRHTTTARVALQAWMESREAAQDWLRTIATYPELDGPRVDELRLADAPPALLLAEARKPCEECARAAGGIDNPEPGRSWECPGCRKEYDPGEYATAVRRSLLDDDGEPSGMGWCTLPTAAAAAADISGKPVTPTTIRTWVARRDNVGLVCHWSPGQRFGVQLVYWPDVARRVTEQRTPGRRGLAS